MKKIALIGLLIVAVMSVSAPAFAFQLTLNGQPYLGPIEFKLFDWSIGRQYTPDQSFTTWTPEGARAGMAAGGQTLTSGVEATPDGVTDGWTIVRITEIVTPGGDHLWGPSANEELTGILYGFDDVYINPNSQGGIDIGSAGGYMNLYLDNTPDFNANAANPTGFPTFGSDSWGATDGSLFLTADFVPGVAPGIGSVTRFENVNSLTSPFSGSGSAYLSVTGGSNEDLFDSNGYLGGNADLYAIFDFNPNNRFGFDSRSSDPVSGNAVPEPATMLLFGTGLFGLVGLRKKA